LGAEIQRLSTFRGGLADVAVVEASKGGVLELPDFYFTGDDYT
jgi:hypothetical protein